MKSGFQKHKDRDSRQRAAIAAKTRKMTEFFEEAACKNKESCSSTTACEKNRMVEVAACKNKVVVPLLLVKKQIVEEAACKNKEGCSSATACEKTRTVEEVEQKVYEVETAYSTVLDYTARYPTDPALFAARPTDSMLVRSIVLHDVCQRGLNDNFSRGQG